MAEQISIIFTTLLMVLVDFKKIAGEFRKVFNLNSTEEFPAVKIAENKIHESYDKYTISIIPDAEWNYKNSVQAYYKHSDAVHEIGIKESVYRKALGGDKDALFSIAHEVVHWGLINHFNFHFGLKDNTPQEAKVILCGIHENLVDLITPLLVLSEAELEKARGAKSNLDYTCLSVGQLDLALFYSQNYDVIQENFKKNIAPLLKKAASKGGIEQKQKKGLA